MKRIEKLSLLVKAKFFSNLHEAMKASPTVHIVEHILKPEETKKEEPYWEDRAYGHGERYEVKVTEREDGWFAEVEEEWWYGGRNSGGWVGRTMTIDCTYIEADGKKYAVAEYHVIDQWNKSSFSHEYDEPPPPPWYEIAIESTGNPEDDKHKASVEEILKELMEMKEVPNYVREVVVKAMTTKEHQH